MPCCITHLIFFLISYNLQLTLILEEEVGIGNKPCGDGDGIDDCTGKLIY